MKTWSRSVGDIKPWLAVLVVTVGMAVAGVTAGAVWAWVAPPIHSAVAVTKSGERVRQVLGNGNEADHYFDAAVMMAGLLVGLAIVSAVLVWQWRQHRGPEMVIGLTVGSLAAAGAAAGVGAILIRLRYGHTDIGTIPADHKIHYITEAPEVFFGDTLLQKLTVLLMPAALAAFTYAIMAAASAHDDLGVRLSVPETVAQSSTRFSWRP